MRALPFAILLALLAAGCSSPGADGPHPTPTGTSEVGPASSTSTPRPEPDWDFALPPLPATGGEPANLWVRGGDLDPAWNATEGTGPGLFQLVWQASWSDRDPPPGYACGVSIGTGTDFDVEHHAIRTRADPLLQPGAVALVSSSGSDRSSGCASKQHLSVAASGNVTSWGQPWGGHLAFRVEANGTVHLDGTSIWLAPGQTAVLRTDRWENRTAAAHASLQPPQPDSVRVTGESRLVHLGAWSVQRVWPAPEDACTSGAEEPSHNCYGPGSGP